MKQAWYKSWALWMSIAALIVYVCKTVCKIEHKIAEEYGLITIDEF